MIWMYRKFLSIKWLGVFAVLLMLFMAVGVAEEEKTDASGQWKYVLEDGGATITGYMEEPGGDLVIPSQLDGHPVTGIGDEAFYDSPYLTGIEIPNGITDIGDNAFQYCFDLLEIIIPDSVAYIGSEAFAMCHGLTTVLIPGSVTSIGAGSFWNCAGLQTVIMETGVECIWEGAFNDCSRLQSVTIPASVTDICESAFINCEELILTVTKGSYAEQYANDNNIPYVIAE
jgi:hypothetical protein